MLVGSENQRFRLRIFQINQILLTLEPGGLLIKDSQQPGPRQTQKRGVPDFYGLTPFQRLPVQGCSVGGIAVADVMRAVQGEKLRVAAAHAAVVREGDVALVDFSADDGGLIFSAEYFTCAEFHDQKLLFH